MRRYKGQKYNHSKIQCYCLKIMISRLLNVIRTKTIEAEEKVNYVEKKEEDILLLLTLKKKLSCKTMIHGNQR